MRDKNIDDRVVADFGEEWARYHDAAVSEDEHRRLFEIYFSEFPFSALPDEAEGFDLGCGSGRWAELLAPKVGKLHCIEAAEAALAVARHRLAGHDNVVFHLGSINETPLAPSSQDFGYALGVLHHVPDTARGMVDCVAKLKPGAPFLVYLYYRFENRPFWFVALWRLSDILRRGICRLPFALKRVVTDMIALSVYWPLARFSRRMERMGLPYENIPLAAYRNGSYKTMRNDALDRFGTRLEQRYTRDEIRAMMEAAGLTNIRFREKVPYWVAVGERDEAT